MIYQEKYFGSPKPMRGLKTSLIITDGHSFQIIECCFVSKVNFVKHSYFYHMLNFFSISKYASKTKLSVIRFIYNKMFGYMSVLLYKKGINIYSGTLDIRISQSNKEQF